jgi:hypothetical protein
VRETVAADVPVDVAVSEDLQDEAALVAACVPLAHAELVAGTHALEPVRHGGSGRHVERGAIGCREVLAVRGVVVGAVGIREEHRRDIGRVADTIHERGSVGIARGVGGRRAFAFINFFLSPQFFADSIDEILDKNVLRRLEV